MHSVVLWCTRIVRCVFHTIIESISPMTPLRSCDVVYYMYNILFKLHRGDNGHTYYYIITTRNDHDYTGGSEYYNNMIHNNLTHNQAPWLSHSYSIPSCTLATMPPNYYTDIVRTQNRCNIIMVPRTIGVISITCV